MGYSVRQGTLNDIDYIVTQLKEFSEFYGSKIHLFDSAEYAKEQMKFFVSNHVVFVAEHKSVGPIGFIVGFVGPHTYNRKINVLTEMFWWVEKAYRNTRAGFILFDEYLKWGKENVDWMVFSLEQKSPVKETFLTKRGFKHMETTYILENV